MLNIKRILTPTDYSELSTHAMTYARDLARTCGSELHVLHVAPPAGNVPLPGAVDGVAVPVELLETSDAIIEREDARLRDAVRQIVGVLPAPPVTSVRLGVVWQEIARYADELQIELIVLGTHTRGFMQRMLLGSNSKAVLEHVACPVLMVPRAALKQAEQRSAALERNDELAAARPRPA